MNKGFIGTVAVTLVAIFLVGGGVVAYNHQKEIRANEELAESFTIENYPSSVLDQDTESEQNETNNLINEVVKDQVEITKTNKKTSDGTEPNNTTAKSDNNNQVVVSQNTPTNNVSTSVEVSANITYKDTEDDYKNYEVNTNGANGKVAEWKIDVECRSHVEIIVKDGTDICWGTFDAKEIDAQGNLKSFEMKIKNDRGSSEDIQDLEFELRAFNYNGQFVGKTLTNISIEKTTEYPVVTFNAYSNSVVETEIPEYGKDNVKGLIFDVKAETADVSLNQLRFAISGSTGIGSYVFPVANMVETVYLKDNSTGSVVAENSFSYGSGNLYTEVFMDDLDIDIEKGETKRFSLIFDIVGWFPPGQNADNFTESNYYSEQGFEVLSFGGSFSNWQNYRAQIDNNLTSGRVILIMPADLSQRIKG